SCVRIFQARSYLAAWSASNSSSTPPTITAQLFCSSSRSSWPGDQPAYPTAKMVCWGPRPCALSPSASLGAVTAMPAGITAAAAPLHHTRSPHHRHPTALDRPAPEEIELGSGALPLAGRHPERTQQLADRPAAGGPVDHDPDCALLGRMRDHEDDGALEARIGH